MAKEVTLTPFQKKVLGLYKRGNRSLSAFAKKCPGVPNGNIQQALNSLGKKGMIALKEKPETVAVAKPISMELHTNRKLRVQTELAQPFIPKEIDPKVVGFEDSVDTYTLVSQLEAENEALKRQVAWMNHSGIDGDLKGGTFTLNSSDYHLFDRGFMLNAWESLTEKICELIEQFEPRRFLGVCNGDMVPGRGIYRNQGMEAILPGTDKQVCAAAFKHYLLDQKIKERFPGMPVSWDATRGNHDYSQGEPIAMQYVFVMRSLGVNISYKGDFFVHNAADRGTYNIFFEHGYGNSTFNPTSNKFIVETLQKLLRFSQGGYIGEKRIRRVAHGHTHWLNVGTERAFNVLFDTTGGMHRNDRANIGMNTRPTGFIGYISPPGSSDILRPIEIRPSEGALRKDIDDPMLEERNREEASRCLMEFLKLGKEIGFLADTEQFISKD